MEHNKQMETTTIKLFKFKDLSETAQQKAIKNLANINTRFDWWYFIYSEANNAELKITEFDFAKKSINGEFVSTAINCALCIFQIHCSGTNTFVTAKKYIEQYSKILNNHKERIDNLNPVGDNYFISIQYDFDKKLKELNEQFLKDILKCFYDILQNEYEYLTSEEGIKDEIIKSDYNFTICGKNIDF
jgi:hypothetical protein